MKDSTLRKTAFSLIGVVILMLVAGSVIEQVYGTAAAVRWVYTAPWSIALWSAAAVCSIACLLRQRVWRQFVTLLLHFSFVVILGGAMLTHLTGEQGTLHLRLSAPRPLEIQGLSLPFNVTLRDFHVECYPGTQAPMDFVSELLIQDGDKRIVGRVSMNNIFTYRHYRFYQSAYDNDRQGTLLSVSHDPWGIAVTYTGYALLFLSMLLFFVQKRTRFRALLRGLSLLLLLILPLVSADAATHHEAQRPPTLSPQTAAGFCNLYVCYNDRICPLQTMARDFTVKLCGKPSWRGLTAEQVLCGYLFFYDYWSNEPCIKIKGRDTRAMLGIDGRYARLNDFVGGGRYKLQNALRQGDRNARAADEKFRLVSMVCSGSLLKLFPLAEPAAQAASPSVRWYSWSDPLPPDAPKQDRQFVLGAVKYISLCISNSDYDGVRDAVSRIRRFQTMHATPACLPSDTRFNAELAYNSLNYVRPMAMACLTLGILLFIFACLLMAAGKSLWRGVEIGLVALMGLVFLLLAFAFVVRWVICGHVPLSNGFETMQFLSLTSAAVSFGVALGGLFRRRHAMLPLCFGFLLCGLTQLVSMMSMSNPQITSLMPVLQSPLLTVHVAVIMLAYCLLAFVMLNGVMALVLRSKRGELMRVSLLLLYPAVFCLTAGIFIGAIWANVSWGRYWGWDPKEVWALITMLVYAVPLHTTSLHWLRRPLFFHIYVTLAFLFVLFTYFGVNFLLGGMHSYA